jgi:Tfp pilus assembly protein PilF
MFTYMVRGLTAFEQCWYKRLLLVLPVFALAAFAAFMCGAGETTASQPKGGLDFLLNYILCAGIGALSYVAYILKRYVDDYQVYRYERLTNPVVPTRSVMIHTGGLGDMPWIFGGSVTGLVFVLTTFRLSVFFLSAVAGGGAKPSTENALAFVDRGNEFLASKDYFSAIEQYNKALALDPRDAVALKNRGIAYLHKKEYDTAIGDFTNAIQLGRKDTQDAKAYLNRGLAYVHKKEFDKAIEDFTRAIQLDTKGGLAYLDRGNAYHDKKEYDTAIKDYDRAILLAPEHSDSYNSFAWLLATCPKDTVRDGKKAIAYATKACELSQWKDANAIGTLAAAEAESGNFKKAVKWQKKSIERGYNDKEKTEKARLRLKLYEEGKPYRDNE